MTSVLRLNVRTLTLAFLTSASLWLALVVPTYAESVKNFKADIVVEADGRLRVTETIEYDFADLQKRGIYRKINAHHPQPASAWFKDRYVKVELVSIIRDGVSEPYMLEPYDGVSVRIGDPSIFYSGSHIYKIEYTLDGAIATYETGPEIYWNITGNEWEVPIESIEIVVTAAEGVSLATEQACYADAVGATSPCLQMRLTENQALFSHKDLNPFEQVTIAQRLVLPQPPQVLERHRTIYLWAASYLLVLGGLITYLLRWRLRYKFRKSVIAQYEPYQSFSPLFTGVLLDSRLDSKDITAGIVSLAERGIISITETKEKVLFFFEINDYQISLLKSAGELLTLTESDRQLLQLLDLDDGRVGMNLSQLRRDTAQQRENQETLQALRKAVKADMVERGFLQRRTTKEIISASAGTAIIVVVISLTSVIFELWSFLFVILIVIVVALLITLGFERRTTLGYEALYHLKGFKDFLSTTEKERYKFHNAPARNTQQFMEYLPYAIAFGVEKEWAEVFKDIPLDQPSWYSSQNNSTFNAVAFTHNLSAFSTSVSSSSGSSGSSGAGSAGGGGGGGGGGSW